MCLLSLKTKAHLGVLLSSAVLLAPVSTAEAGPILSPAAGSTLKTSISSFSWAADEGAQKVLLWAGTESDPKAYSRSLVPEGLNRHSLGRLPLDGSEVFITKLWYDGDKWHREQPVGYISSTTPVITAPAPGSTLSGNAVSFDMIPRHGERRIKLGTASNARAYGVIRGSYKVGLPVDGSEILATYRWYDGRRWREELPVSYTAASAEASGIWGECESVERLGVKPRVAADFSSLIDLHKKGASLGGISSTLSPANRFLRDDCASDSHYIAASNLDVYVSRYEKGVYLWLSADSGPAVVRVAGFEEEGNPVRTASIQVIQPDAGITAPVYVKLVSYDVHSLSIRALYADQPVKISEIRMAGANDDVSDLRKGRFLGSGRAFAASNSDPRARVTAEIAQSFAPVFTSSEGWKRSFNCGSFTWIDATWEIDESVVVKNYTVWVNFNHATNAEIHAAIRESLNPSIWYCRMPTDEMIEQDWVGKAEAALNGSYQGPVLSY